MAEVVESPNKISPEKISPELKRHEAESNDRTIFGFWVYLMTDLLMFSVLFAAFAVLHGNSAGGPTGRELFSMPVALAETLLLLTSSFTAGLGLLSARWRNKGQTLLWFGITFVLGVAFLTLELREFGQFIHEGHTWQTSAFLSSFFALVGTHGLHITFGLTWMATTLVYVLKRGLNSGIVRKLTYLSLFWHFLDIVWIFIFTIVYLMALV